MRKASMILGIVGGVIAVLISLFLIFVVSPKAPQILSSQNFSYYSQTIPMDEFVKIVQDIYTALGITGIIGGVLGFVGGILVKRKNVIAGVLMIIGTLLSCINPLILVGAILAFIREKHPSQQYVPYTPYPNQPPYSGQPPYVPQNPPYSGQPQYPPQNPQYTGQPPYVPQNPGYPNGQQNLPQYPSRDNEQK